jgi:hypothetical protein
VSRNSKALHTEFILACCRHGLLPPFFTSSYSLVAMSMYSNFTKDHRVVEKDTVYALQPHSSFEEPDQESIEIFKSFANAKKRRLFRRESELQHLIHENLLEPLVKSTFL